MPVTVATHTSQVTAKKKTEPGMTGSTRAKHMTETTRGGAGGDETGHSNWTSGRWAKVHTDPTLGTLR